MPATRPTPRPATNVARFHMWRTPFPAYSPCTALLFPRLAIVLILVCANGRETKGCAFAVGPDDLVRRPAELGRIAGTGRVGGQRYRHRVDVAGDHRSG